MTNTCPKCKGQIGREGKWPVTVGGNLVEGCQDCFDKEADEAWWEVVSALPEEKE